MSATPNLEGGMIEPPTHFRTRSTLTRVPPVPPVAPRHLKLERRYEDDTLILIVRGEIDIASAPALEHDLRLAEASGPRRIVIDLAALEFVDATGLQVLVQAQERADFNGHRLVLSHVPAPARRLLRITGVDARLGVA